ncbi:MAG: hypothetical protein IT426_14515 [Pirellulales bacterium]|nr:hypothetical protein [Pirellulales bacterium]
MSKNLPTHLTQVIRSGEKMQPIEFNNPKSKTQGQIPNRQLFAPKNPQNSPKNRIPLLTDPGKIPKPTCLTGGKKSPPFENAPKNGLFRSARMNPTPIRAGLSATIAPLPRSAVFHYNSPFIRTNKRNRSQGTVPIFAAQKTMVP